MKMVYDVSKKFKILKDTVSVYSEHINGVLCNVVELNNLFYYIGDEDITLFNVALAWQELTGKTLSTQDFQKIKDDNC